MKKTIQSNFRAFSTNRKLTRIYDCLKETNVSFMFISLLGNAPLGSIFLIHLLYVSVDIKKSIHFTNNNYRKFPYVANVVDYDIMVSESELESHYCIHFKTNYLLGKM